MSMGSSSLTGGLLSQYSECLFIIFCACSLFRFVSSQTKVYVSSIPVPVNFTAASQELIDNAGAFLVSDNRSFEARLAYSSLLSTLERETSSVVYLFVAHVSSDTIVWSANANRNHPLLQSSSLLRLTEDGLTLYNNDTSQPIWSTPPPNGSSVVSSMHLLESGNLLLLDANNDIVWQSFDFPTDTLVAAQKLHVGKSLVASQGNYSLVVGDDDATLQWNGMIYWKLSMDGDAFRDTASPVDFLMVNVTGVFLMGGRNGDEVVIMIKGVLNDTSANSSDFVFAKLHQRGSFNIVAYNPVDPTIYQVFDGPDDKCQIPMICRRLGVCSSNGGSCWCEPGGFQYDPKIYDGDCVPTDPSLLLQPSCTHNASLPEDKENFKYLALRNDLDYFSNDFTDPVIRDVNVSSCQNLCSKNCSCLGVFYAQSSGSCYMIQNYLGSMKSGSRNRVGYVKMVAVGGAPDSDMKKKSDFPIIAAVLLPLSLVLVIIAMAVVIFLRRRRRRMLSKKIARSKLNYEDEDIDFVSIPGLPVRIDYEELAEATQGFKTQIGSGGFGTVYKGTLRDGSEVAVKKITCLGAQGKREFLSEILVIGKIQHLNLVKLKGFCVHSGQRLLIYEYMNRGSLDRTLFDGEAVLEWEDRCKIAVGAARGLEYLHSGCESRIIHCDVKPENILLNDKLQVKVADFGLSKLLSREQSGFFTTMRGTRGYVAPEWLTNTPISDKTDVYSYGMMLLEIISGIHNFSLQHQINSPEEHELCVVNFPLRALEMHMRKRYIELVDPRLTGNAPSKEVEKLVRVALCCLHRDPYLRPSMSNVVRMLEGGMALRKPRLELLNYLRFYGTGAVAVAENNQQNELALDRQEMSSATTSYHSFSYISSHQVSGPR